MQEFIKELNNYLKTLGNFNICVDEYQNGYDLRIYYYDNNFKYQSLMSISKEKYNKYKNDLVFKLTMIYQIVKDIAHTCYESKEQTTKTQVTH